MKCRLWTKSVKTIYIRRNKNNVWYFAQEEERKGAGVKPSGINISDGVFLETIRSFIDTNVIVHWLILSKIKDRNKESKELWTRYDRIKHSFEFMEQVITHKDKSQTFLTSDLALAEIYYGLYDEAKCSKMYKDGVPLSSWSNVKYSKKFPMTSDDINDIYKSVQRLLNIISGKITIVNDSYNFRNVATFVLKEKLRTHDAILLSEAMKHKCDYFVTNDADFDDIKLDASKYIKDIDSDKNAQYDVLKIIKPVEYNSKFFKKRSDD